MIRATGVEDYRDITHGAGFYRNWFKKFKGDFDRIFMTGVFNSDMTLYHLKHLVATGEPPRNMVDANIRTDCEKLRTIADLRRMVLKMEPQDALPMTEQTVATGGVQFPLVESFPAEAIIRPENFRSLYYYYGLLSMVGRKMGQVVFGVPNACVEKQIYG